MRKIGLFGSFYFIRAAVLHVRRLRGSILRSLCYDVHMNIRTIKRKPLIGMT